MNRYALPVLAAVIACSAIGQARADDAPVMYGLLDMSAGRFQEPGQSRVLRAESGRFSSSYIGVRGSDDLGGGLAARFGLESYVRVDTGAAGRTNTDPFWARAAYVGLQGSFGVSLLGRLPTPLYTATRLFNPFGESPGFSPTMRQYFDGAVLGDSRWNNSVAFSSAEPEGGQGFTYSVQFNSGESAPGATGKNISAGVLYHSGPLAAGAVWQRVRNGVAALPAGFGHQDTYHLGASYEFPAVRIYGQAGRVKTDAATDARTVLYQVGAAVPVGVGFVIGAYGHSKTESLGNGTLRRTASLAYDYFLSRRTDLYAALMNERITNLSSATTVAAGVRVRF